MCGCWGNHPLVASRPLSPGSWSVIYLSSCLDAADKMIGLLAEYGVPAQPRTSLLATRLGKGKRQVPP
jgi:hypothetical protein